MAPKKSAKTKEIEKAPDKVFKSFATETKASADARTIQFTITTGGVDRDNDTVDPAGWDLGNYQKNPVVLFAHDYEQLPVGKAIELKLGGDKISAVVEFPEVGVYPFADTVYELTKAGFLNATSVGFKPSEYTINEDRRGLDFKKQELLEFSIVPIPSNPQALVEARAAGIDTEPILKWATSALAKYGKEDKLSSSDKKSIKALRDKLKSAHGNMADCIDHVQQMMDGDYQSDAASGATEKWTAASVEDFKSKAAVLKTSMCPHGTACPKDPNQYWCPDAKCPFESAANSGEKPPAQDGVSPATSPQQQAAAVDESKELFLVEMEEDGAPVLYITDEKGAGDGQDIDLQNPHEDKDDTEEDAVLVDAADVQAAISAMVSQVVTETVKALKGRID